MVAGKVAIESEVLVFLEVRFGGLSKTTSSWRSAVSEIQVSSFEWSLGDQLQVNVGLELQVP